MPNNVKVLLVDDNPMVLGLLQGALTPLASVTTSSDTADARADAIETASRAFAPSRPLFSVPSNSIMRASSPR